MSVLAPQPAVKVCQFATGSGSKVAPWVVDFQVAVPPVGDLPAAARPSTSPSWSRWEVSLCRHHTSLTTRTGVDSCGSGRAAPSTTTAPESGYVADSYRSAGSRGGGPVGSPPCEAERRRDGTSPPGTRRRPGHRRAWHPGRRRRCPSGGPLHPCRRGPGAVRALAARGVGRLGPSSAAGSQIWCKLLTNPPPVRSLAW